MAALVTHDPKRNTPMIDLGTVRETLAYIRDDLQRVPGLERAAELLGSALDRKSTRLNSSHIQKSRMPSSA